MDGRDEAVFVIVDVKHRHRDSTLDLHKINRRSKRPLDVSRIRPLSRIRYVIPLGKRLLRILMMRLPPKSPQLGMANNPHSTAYIMYTRLGNVNSFLEIIGITDASWK